jgi:hypothetical protein
MYKKIAIKKLMNLKKKYNGFINVGLDNWRGYRFIFDTLDVRRCNNDCQNCPLYILLKNEKRAKFSSGLYLANKKDRTLFGPQKFLNCKTLEQYKNCYINFIKNKTKTEKQIIDELRLIKNFVIIFSKGNNLSKMNANFKKSLIKKLINTVDPIKAIIITKGASDLKLNLID